MKVVIFTLNASYIHRSLSLRCLAPRLRDCGFETVTVEYSVKEKRINILERLYNENADIYGFSCYIWNIAEMKQTADKLKKLLPSSKIVFGGPEVSYETEDFFKANPYVDYIVSGDGEASLPALCEKIRNGTETSERIVRSLPYGDFTSAGILYDIDTCLDSSIVYYESSRGCPYRCAYCLSAAEDGIIAKDTNTVLRELLEFEKLSGSIKVIKFVDRTFNFNRKRAVAVWQGLLSEAYTKKYHFEICAELLDEEAFDVLSRFPAGKIQLEAGIQSTNPKTLAAIDRVSNTGLCVKNLIRVKNMKNIHIHADLIAGLPFEDMESFARSFDDVYGSCDMLQLGFLKLLKGSPLYEHTAEYGIVFTSDPPYEILKTNWLSFTDVVRLHRINDALERFGNSGRFSYTLSAVTQHTVSPFRFFDSLAEFIGDIDGLSQIRAFELFCSFCRFLGVIPEDELIGRLRLDFYTGEAGSCPKFLSEPVELSVTPVIRDLFIKKAADTKNVSACEVHKFSFDRDGIYLIDRKQHKCVRMTEHEILDGTAGRIE